MTTATKLPKRQRRNPRKTQRAWPAVVYTWLSVSAVIHPIYWVVPHIIVKLSILIVLCNQRESNHRQLIKFLHYSVEQIHSVGTISNTKTSYSRQLSTDNVLMSVGHLHHVIIIINCTTINQD